jgi:hypothetical protein
MDKNEYTERLQQEEDTQRLETESDIQVVKLKVSLPQYEPQLTNLELFELIERVYIGNDFDEEHIQQIEESDAFNRIRRALGG